KLVREFAVGVANIDWEDIATDDAGHLYIGEIGNNDNRLPLRAIYRLDEPDPAVPREKPLPVTLASYYKFPPGGRFDAESRVRGGARADPRAKARPPPRGRAVRRPARPAGQGAPSGPAEADRPPGGFLRAGHGRRPVGRLPAAGRLLVRRGPRLREGRRR